MHHDGEIFVILSCQAPSDSINKLKKLSSNLEVLLRVFMAFWGISAFKFDGKIEQLKFYDKI